MIKYFYCDDLNIIKKEVNFNTSFSTQQFNTTSLLSDINTIDLFSPTNDYLIMISEINLNDILYVHNSIIDNNKNITFILPRELRPKELEFFLLHQLKYTHLEINALAIINYLQKYVSDNDIQIDATVLIKIADLFGDINLAINEVAKLNAFAYPEKIENKHFKLITTNVEELNVFKLIELYLKGQNTDAIKLFDKLVDVGYSEIAIIETMYSQIRLLLQIQALRNNSATSIAGILKVHKYRINTGIKLLSNVDKKNLYKFLNNISYIDYKCKNGTCSNENIKLEIIII